MHGHDVTDVQRLLGVEADGQFGPVTAAAVREWKRTRGDSAASPELSPADRGRLGSDVPVLAVRTMERWAAEGLCEDPPGSNRVPELVALADRLDVSPAVVEMGFPWCAFAAFLAALASGGKSAVAGLRRGEFNALYAPDVLIAAEAGRFGLRVVSADEAWRGDLVLFDWDLTGGDQADHVARLADGANGLVRTVDGNSGPGGCVALRERAAGSVRAFVRDS